VGDVGDEEGEKEREDLPSTMREEEEHPIFS
jgi:hypothetical protein